MATQDVQLIQFLILNIGWGFFLKQALTLLILSVLK